MRYGTMSQVTACHVLYCIYQCIITIFKENILQDKTRFCNEIDSFSKNLSWKIMLIEYATDKKYHTG